MTRNRGYGQWRRGVVHALSEEMGKEHQAGEAKLYEAETHGPSSREKSFYRFLYRGQHLRFDFRKSPNRKWDVAGFGLWGQTHERDTFQQPKNCSSWLLRTCSRAKVNPPSSFCLQLARVPSVSPPITPEPVFPKHSHIPPLDTGPLLTLHQPVTN